MRRIVCSATSLVALLGWGCAGLTFTHELSPEGGRVHLVAHGQPRPALSRYERVGPRPHWLFPITCERQAILLIEWASDEEIVEDCYNELRNRAAKKWQADLVVITDVSWGGYYDRIADEYDDCMFARCVQVKASVYRRKRPPGSASSHSGSASSH